MMPRRAHPLSVLVVVLLPILLCLAPGAQAQDGVAADKAALTALYNATDGGELDHQHQLVEWRTVVFVGTE